MFRTLVTLGYHYGELPWGRVVRDEYVRLGMRDERDLIFHEVANSNVETGYPCSKSADEIARVARHEKAGLWIDIHCGFDGRFGRDPVFLSYDGMEDALLAKASNIPGVCVNDWRKIPEDAPIRYARYLGIPLAFADAFFSRFEFEKKGPLYMAKLKRTAEFINQMHDIHQSVA